MVTKEKKVDPRLAAAELEYRIWKSLARSQAALDLIEQRVRFLRARRRNVEANEYAKNAGDAGKVAVRPYHNLPILVSNINKIQDEHRNEFDFKDKVDMLIMSEWIAMVVSNFGKESPSDLSLVREANPCLMKLIEHGHARKEASIRERLFSILGMMSAIEAQLGIKNQ